MVTVMQMFLPPSTIYPPLFVACFLGLAMLHVFTKVIVVGERIPADTS